MFLCNYIQYYELDYFLKYIPIFSTLIKIMVDGNFVEKRVLSNIGPGPWSSEDKVGLVGNI